MIIVAFDDGGADHEDVPLARHNVERVARMHQTYGPCKGEFRVVNDERFALYAAQVGLVVLGAEAAAVDDPIGFF